MDRSTLHQCAINRLPILVKEFAERQPTDTIAVMFDLRIKYRNGSTELAVALDLLGHAGAEPRREQVGSGSGIEQRQPTARSRWHVGVVDAGPGGPGVVVGDVVSPVFGARHR